MQTDFFNELLDEPTKEFLRVAQHDFEAVDKPGNTVPHKNEQVLAEDVVLDLSVMDNESLQTLYEEICSYQDLSMKAALFMQLKQERPDFKPQINAKQFLLYVAYGEQDEAEALLQADSLLAQELLRANGTEFTDYSGRTFTCSAYEYAWWAKDTHMQRMLEKYIKIDEETRQFILRQVQEIEALVLPNFASGFFEPPKPKGIHYTTESKSGEIIHHQEAHFDLTPLKRALTHFIEEANSRPEMLKKDCEVLNTVWVEEVGRVQRELPAHIAQEYCHPRRPLSEVARNKSLLDASNPNNLKRRLAFVNPETETDDLWFIPGAHLDESGLGVSCAILRAGAVMAGTMCMSEQVPIDLAAIIAIDEVRTGDLSQSLEYLSAPLITPTP
jgi:hypothetical protein